LISVSHTHNLIYAKSYDYFKEHRQHFRLPEDGEGFANPDGDLRGPWKADPFQVGGERPNQLYAIENPKTGEVYRPNPGCSWKNEYTVFQQLLADNRIVFGVSGEAGPQRKRFLSEAEERGKVTKTLWEDIDTTTNATRHLKELMGGSVFDNPKPVELISRFVQLGTHDPDGAIVLDFFAGSGTTGHAVLDQNARDGGTRRFVLVQLPEQLDNQDPSQRAAAEFCIAQKVPERISEISKERLRRSGQQVKQTNPAFSGDTGFRVWRLDSGNVRPWAASRDTLTESLAAAVDHVKPDRSEDDLLYDMILKHGLDLCAAIDEKRIGGHKVRSVGGGAVFACFGSRITAADVEQLADGIAKWRDDLAPANPELSRVVFRDSAFETDVAKTNLALILKERGFDEKLVVSL
jgi:adenine-specific DNA-methyltransferase